MLPVSVTLGEEVGVVVVEGFDVAEVEGVAEIVGFSEGLAEGVGVALPFAITVGSASLLLLIFTLEFPKESTTDPSDPLFRLSLTSALAFKSIGAEAFIVQLLAVASTVTSAFLLPAIEKTVFFFSNTFTSELSLTFKFTFADFLLQISSSILVFFCTSISAFFAETVIFLRDLPLDAVNFVFLSFRFMVLPEAFSVKALHESTVIDANTDLLTIFALGASMIKVLFLLSFILGIVMVLLDFVEKVMVNGSDFFNSSTNLAFVLTVTFFDAALTGTVPNTIAKTKTMANSLTSNLLDKTRFFFIICSSPYIL